MWVLTVGVLLAVGIALVLQTVRATTPPPIPNLPPETAGPSPTPDKPAGPTDEVVGIDFASLGGQGRLSLVGHREEVVDGVPVTVVELEITCTEGEVSYSMTSFDSTGVLTDADQARTPAPSMVQGRISEGSTIRGFVAYPLPAKGLTVVMESMEGESVTALRLPG